MPREFKSAVRPTMYFIGVTTQQSSIHRIFPRWAEQLNLGDCELRGMDFPLRAAPAEFRAAVDFIRHDPLTRGALVTSHKVDLHAACARQFDEIEPLSNSLGEISSIYKRNGRLFARSVDPWTCGYALHAFLPVDHWRNGGEVLILGAGGSGTALAWHLTQATPAENRPPAVHVVDRNPDRLAHLRTLHASWAGASPLKMHETADTTVTDQVLHRLPPRSLVVNATGVGKDLPGSPLGPDAVFPRQGFVWEFNYRGELQFLQQARAQQVARQLHVEDGWVYFLHGWTRVVADVFACDIPISGAGFETLGRIAAEASGRPVPGK